MTSLISLPFITQLEQNLKNSPQFLQVILGPRQVGKTTTTLEFLNSSYAKKHDYYSADKILHSQQSWLIEVWQKARTEKKLLVIDEIQKIENWAEIIKQLWDEDKRLKKNISCILLGSSSLELHIGLTESLAGRFQMIPAYHWNFSESQAGYDLSFEEHLKFGGYPGSYALRQDMSSWLDYLKYSIIDAAIVQDILGHNKVKSPALFKQVFEILTNYPAQEISYTKLLGQLQDKGNTDLIKHYIRFYEGAFLIKALEKFSLKPLKRKSSSPKILPLCPAFYFLETQPEYSSEERGRAFEVMVGCALNRLPGELYYWREGKFEVDYVLKFGKKIWAIEVKSGRKHKLTGLDAFLKLVPKAKPLVITPENYLELETNPAAFLGE